jgi:hypothetical protein
VFPRSAPWVCSRLIAGLWVRIPLGGIDVCLSLVSVVCCQVEVSATGRSLVQRTPTAYGVAECDCEDSITRIRVVAPWAGVWVGVCGIFPPYTYKCYRLSIVIPSSVAFNYRFFKSNFMFNFMVQISVCYIINFPFLGSCMCPSYLYLAKYYPSLIKDYS